ncbi:hypothetical protein GALMADRAFT_828949 [Galerina marginata CBS 339.88]|uniref:F-box domain-containing protein n=1 Tax=Galerina marginata (strain CBS 339.88) TaxID=685588 RepID=A0A067TUA2_GALM3|nr:hypothetical protein GALMADRAFT_828949 [Galerina marginata CBS 339.88]
MESLPNLMALKCFVPPASLSRLMSSIRHAPLLKLFIDTGLYQYADDQFTAGPTGRESLSIKWNVDDNFHEPDSALAHLYQFIQPSLTTLVELRIDNTPTHRLTDFDFQLLKPAGDTFTAFHYVLRTQNDSILDVIPEVFPHLTNLAVVWMVPIDWRGGHSILWKDGHIRALAKNQKLVELTLSSDLEVAAKAISDTCIIDIEWHLRCYKRRLAITEEIAQECPHLGACSWVLRGMDDDPMVHPFFVEGRMSGDKAIRVVRGVEQWWMGGDHDDWDGGEGIVKSKFEDLPGEVLRCDRVDIAKWESGYWRSGW